MGLGSSRPRRNTVQFNAIDTPDAAAVGVPIVTALGVEANAQDARAPANAPAQPQPTASAAPLTLAVSSEKIALASGDEHKLLAMLSLKAPAAPDQIERPGIDLVAVIDRSGSMQGDKMNLMKQTLDLLVKRAGLKEGDRLSLVSFDREVKLELPLTGMDDTGRNAASAVVKRLHPGSTTNLSGGALKAIDVLDASAASSRGWFGAGKTDDKHEGGVGRTRAIMLFTDGLANEGIRDPAALQAAVTTACTAASAKLGGPISFFTFGFGRDHNENCLRELATASSAGGLYYYVKSAEDIPNAFADCLGGLTSVVVQNATLSLEGLAGASVARVLGSTYQRDADGAINLGDLFAEDEKDILIELSVPTLSAPAAAAGVLRASLRAFNVVLGAPDAVSATLELARPLATPADQPVNQALDAQRNRIQMAESIEEAARLADMGNLAAGRQMLHAAQRRVATSDSAGCALSSNLVAESEALVANYSSEMQYRSVGSKMSKMSAMSHGRQRANHMQSADMYAGGSKRKASMKAKWMSSLAGDDSDSD